jgi:hypothetical protein
VGSGIEAGTLGEGWLRASRAIPECGAPAVCDGEATLELALPTLRVARPASDDVPIAELGHPGWLAWMHDSLDFGKKAYGNLVELALLEERVAAGVGAPVEALVVHAKSAHVYRSELELMGRLTARTAAPAEG